MITAKFGSKSFEVSSKKIYTPNGISISEELNLEETEINGKKPSVKVKGIKLQGLSFDLKLDSRFVDVDTELRWWKNTLLAKKSQLFYLGAYTVGKFFLTKYDLKDTAINKNGILTKAVLSLSFSEDGAYANSNKIVFETTKKAAAVKSGTTKQTIGIGSTIKPKSGVRWYYTAEGALKKTGKSGKAYQKNLVVTYVYKKSGKIVCVNPKGLGWLKVEDVTLVSGSSSSNNKSSTNKSSSSNNKSSNSNKSSSSNNKSSNISVGNNSISILEMPAYLVKANVAKSKVKNIGILSGKSGI